MPAGYTLIAIALGGSAGALARFGMATLIQQWASQHSFWQNLPLGTWLVNILGSCATGILYVLLTEKLLLAESWRPLLVVGFLGAFTTFSSFSLETLQLLERGMALQALLYTLSSVLFCLLACWLGMALTRALA
jgi:CrcB protein